MKFVFLTGSHYRLGLRILSCYLSGLLTVDEIITLNTCSFFPNQMGPPAYFSETYFLT